MWFHLWWVGDRRDEYLKPFDSLLSLVLWQRDWADQQALDGLLSYKVTDDRFYVIISPRKDAIGPHGYNRLDMGTAKLLSSQEQRDSLETIYRSLVGRRKLRPDGRLASKKIV